MLAMRGWIVFRLWKNWPIGSLTTMKVTPAIGLSTGTRPRGGRLT
jgi:hypothetical protein